ncbi:FAD-linked oxidoreductase auro [Colletotrichum spaethianum]|uniref:FAD-linked oxidoreductase auro n=1 Tax=Colletotrichum spaethianum TaxID=700344 RepID=A0AA37UP08_9PEZI|nr:FAD-linked oxidoreductase auro [Colletotrichum spaethianum]GKT49710.1 FAD-linked oxidoreductase auro [Colletotrichum spaethianum]
MAELEASAEFRASHPAASTPDQLASDAPQLQDISERVPGLLIYTLSAEGYEEVRTFFNASMTQQPLAIIRPRTEAEVSAVVLELHAQNIPFGIRSGGHDMSAAQAQGREGIIIDLRGLDSISINEDKKSARIGGGVLGIKLSKFLQQHKLLTPHGWCQTVSIAGWALGGGYGYTSAFHGLGVDQVLGARVVLANGKTVDTDDHPDLIWALRGAGNGNFGIVVELRVKLYPQTGFLAGFLGFPSAQAGDVLTKFSEFEKELPINFTGEASHLTLPGVGPVIAWLFVWISENDNLDDGWAYLEKMKALGTPVLNTVSAVDDYTFFNTMPSPTNTHWHPRLRIFEHFTPEVAKVFHNHPPPGATCATVIHYMHGRALERNPGACYPLRIRHRIAAASAGVIDPTAQAAEYEEYKKWADDLADDLSKQGHALPYGYRNLSSEKDMNWVATYGKETVARLKEVKNKFDPANFFKTGYPRLDLL